MGTVVGSENPSAIDGSERAHVEPRAERASRARCLDECAGTAAKGSVIATLFTAVSPARGLAEGTCSPGTLTC